MATNEEKIAALTAALQQPEGKYTHAQIKDRLNQLTSQFSQPASPGGEAPAPEPEDTFGDRMSRGYHRLTDAASSLPVRLGARAIDAATLGLYDKGLNAIDRATGGRTHFGVTPEQAAADEQEHPFLAHTADAIGYMAPGGAPAKIGEGVARAADPILNAAAKRGLATRMLAKTTVGAGTGAATAALVRGGEDVVAGKDPGEIKYDVERQFEGPWYTNPAIVGGGLGAASASAGEAARAARSSSPDLAILHKYGLEPGPVPGRPVIRQDQPIASQLPGVSEPPLGVSRATPQTRGAAARAAADVIVPDLAERARANNQRFGQMRDEAYAREGRNPARINDALNLIDQHLSDPGMPDTTRVALGKLRARVIDQSIPTKHGIFVRSDDLDRVRDYADYLGRQERAAKASDVPLRQAADAMRASVKDAAPGIAKINDQQHDILTGFEQRRATLGVPKPSERGGATSEKTLQSVAGRIQQSGEETATGGRATVGGRTRSERLADLGAPPTLPGPRASNTETRAEFNMPPDVPPEPTYGAHLDVPRLQLAQENLQITPSKVFSGAGQPVTSGAGVAHRLLHAAPTRLLYPLARRAGDMDVGAKPLAADALISALRNRRDKAIGNWQTDQPRSE